MHLNHLKKLKMNNNVCCLCNYNSNYYKINLSIKLIIQNKNEKYSTLYIFQRLYQVYHYNMYSNEKKVCK